MHDLVVDAEVLIDRAGRYPFIEHPAEFNRHVREFLRKAGTS